MATEYEITRDIFDTGGRALRHQGLRRANEKTVMTVIGFNYGASNAEISRLSGLAPQTVSAILVDLEREGLIKRGSVLRGRRGQPATPIMLDKDGAYAIGVELGWRHVDVLLVNLHAEVLAHHQVRYPWPDAETIIEVIGNFVDDLKGRLPKEKRKRLVDIGVAMPGRMADNLDLVGAPCEQVALWRDKDVAAELQARCGLAVSILNDGNAACWAELIALERPRPANVHYFMVSSYLNAGIIGDGKLWSGPTGHAADLGSMLVHVDESGPRDAHSIATVSALSRRLREAGLPHDMVDIANWDWSAIDHVVEPWIAECTRVLARTAYNANTVIEAPLLIIDSMLDRTMNTRIANRLKRELDKLPVRNFTPPNVVQGKYGARAPAVGAAELPLFRRYF